MALSLPDRNRIFEKERLSSKSGHYRSHLSPEQVRRLVHCPEIFFSLCHPCCIVFAIRFPKAFSGEACEPLLRACDSSLHRFRLVLAGNFAIV